MDKTNQKNMINVQSIELSPGKPDACLGNGEYEFECCCDECDHYLLCFPEFDTAKKERSVSL